MPQLTLPVTDACQIVNCQVFSRRSNFGFEMADEFTSNTFPHLPPASLDPSVPRRGPYLFHGGGMQNPQYPLLSTNCAYGDCECFAAGPDYGILSICRNICRICERNVVSFGEIRRESVRSRFEQLESSV